MIIYILGIIILCIICFFLYIRIKYAFWSLQPVFHFYDLYYWFVNVGVIRPELPLKNRYVNLQKIKSIQFNNLSKLTKKKITTLIQLNYYRNNENKFYPKQENIDPYFIGHTSKTFCSCFFEDELFIDNKTNKTITESNIIGVITSRPLHVFINCDRKDASFDVYYVDYFHNRRNS